MNETKLTVRRWTLVPCRRHVSATGGAPKRRYRLSRVPAGVPRTPGGVSQLAP